MTVTLTWSDGINSTLQNDNLIPCSDAEKREYMAHVNQLLRQERSFLIEVPLGYGLYKDSLGAQFLCGHPR